MKITCLILTKNNEKTIAAVLDSLQGLEVIVGDLGSNDATLEICRDKAKVIKLNSKRPDLARNELSSLVTDGLLFHIEPYEILTNRLELSKNVYKVKIIQDNILTKETRIWPAGTALNFENPLYPKVVHDSLEANLILYSRGSTVPLDEGLNVLASWESEQPKLSDIGYYRACLYLSHKKYNEFIIECKKYLFKEKKGIVSFLLRYYLSLILLHIKGDTKEASKNIIYCLFYHPELSELWCLLGDVFYKTNNYEKAKSFYKNAVVMGQNRKNTDWPLEIDKCKEYPNKMIASCEDILKKSIFLVNEV
jgi:glycosyltransferase involved in cell wall biosynthesis